MVSETVKNCFGKCKIASVEVKEDQLEFILWKRTHVVAAFQNAWAVKRRLFNAALSPKDTISVI